MSQLPKPPETYREFTRRFPQVGKAWEMLGDAGLAGPLDEKSARLIKLGIAIGCMREGAVHSAVRKATAAGATPADIDQVPTLAASTLGLPATVAAYTWVRDVLEPTGH